MLTIHWQWNLILFCHAVMFHWVLLGSNITIGHDNVNKISIQLIRANTKTTAMSMFINFLFIKYKNKICLSWPTFPNNLPGITQKFVT